MDIGIDKIGFYTPKNYIDIVDLAKARNQDPDKFTIGIGQEKQAVPMPYEDAVTMAAEAASQVLDDTNRSDIGLLIVGTESSVDESKASALFLTDLLGLPADVRAFEIKEACYGATAGLQTARDYIAANPDKKALVIASDIARYGLNTPGEVTQGAGAVAMLLSADPRILKLENKSTFMSRNVGDFWRPTFSKTAFARGKYSNQIYIAFFSTLWEQFQEKYDVTAADFKAMLFHIPYTKMGSKAMKILEGNIDEAKLSELKASYQESIKFGKVVGNLYTGSLYLSLLSYLLNANIDSNEEILLFSYGSGSMGELFSGKIQPGFKDAIDIKTIENILQNRNKINISEYEEIFGQGLENGQKTDVKAITSTYYLSEIKENERIYQSHN
ncbi:hydroxymethylglutaryl-CoA synthase [Companilactobacillus mishanensis]|uniref:Hydroxymethylglutaryl-CoA synthase n=1 Tax=Companilactobacillus mishanensis TaxID=2486008 RepID=A0A5P0ZFN8_9LACO|nr:hydroxymethylglutaryl-CoA synthase [Companilactobacillus mishanensis]MQS51809.1 hydroxymethylglutaryl-CoA synthase [Companilactobacillus mishanensis]